LEGDLIDPAIAVLTPLNAEQDLAIRANNGVGDGVTTRARFILVLILIPTTRTEAADRFILRHVRDGQLHVRTVWIRHPFDHHFCQLVIWRLEECWIGYRMRTDWGCIDRKQSDMYISACRITEAIIDDELESQRCRARNLRADKGRRRTMDIRDCDTRSAELRPGEGEWITVWIRTCRAIELDFGPSVDRLIRSSISDRRMIDVGYCLTVTGALLVTCPSLTVSWKLSVVPAGPTKGARKVGFATVASDNVTVGPLVWSQVKVSGSASGSKQGTGQNRAHAEHGMNTIRSISHTL
jgi:hypothetical protein